MARARLFTELDDALDAAIANGNASVWRQGSKWKVSTGEPPEDVTHYYKSFNGRLGWVDASWARFYNKMKGRELA